MSLFAPSLRRFSIFFYLGMTLAGLGALLTTGLFFIAIRELPQVPEPLGRIIETPPTEIFAATGERLIVIGGREVVPLNRISPFFIKAVIATEDHRFWEHHGLDKLRTLKALWVTLFERGRIQGASTITQQLAKTLFLTPRKTVLRKIKEAFLAFQLERRYTKDEILELYLNQVYFGSGAYGVESAARIFFGKPARDLTLAQCALIAGLPKSPSRYSPLIDKDLAIKRRNIVLKQMKDTGIISETAFAQAKQEQIYPVKQNNNPVKAPYFVDYVKNFLETTLGASRHYKGGLTVYTTLDFNLQKAAEHAVANGLSALEKRMKTQKIKNPTPEESVSLSPKL